VTSREQMLERVRKALGRTANNPSPVPDYPAPPEGLRDVMPPIASDELLPKFEEELGRVGGVAYRAATREALDEILRGILSRSNASRVVLSRNPLLARLGLAERLSAWGQSTEVWKEADARAFRKASFGAEVGITGVDFALAETGSLIVTSETEGSQLASLAPPIHVALYRRSQLFGSLDEVLERLPLARQAGKPASGRSVVFITGTSRTADIEQILIQGVHGPREVHAILVEDSCF
jgi:L-lactate dehydrogenase complex protein LldG